MQRNDSLLMDMADVARSESLSVRNGFDILLRSRFASATELRCITVYGNSNVIKG